MESSTIVQQLEVPAGVGEAEAGSLYAALQGVTDGRAQRGRRYEAATVVVIIMLAKLAGETSLSGVAQWARLRAAWLRTQLPLARLGLPCANTYRNVCAQLDVAQLNQRLARCLLGREEACADEGALVAAEQQGARHLAVDGKSLCGTQRQGVAAQAAQQVVGLYDVERQVMVRQVACAGKGQERAAAQQVVAGLDLAGCVVTADALHTQVQWCQTVLGLGGDYLLIAKRNQRNLHAAIRDLFSEAPVPWLVEQQARTVDKGHGRLTVREIRVSQELNDYLAPTWPAVAQVFQLTRTTTRHQHTTQQVVVGLTSLPPHVAPPARLLALVRAHWQLENRVHWRRDATLGEDACQVATSRAAQVLATLNNTILALMDTLAVPNMAAQMRTFAAQPAAALQLLLHPL
jgi:predicted transposase YbfD/YdcC